MFYPNLDDELQSVVLQKYQYAINRAFDLDGPVNTELRAEWENMWDWDARRMVVRIKAYVLGEKLQEQTVTYPKDWWQAVKERWFPKWAKVRWPVKFTTVTLEARALYPRISLPKEQHCIHVYKRIEPEWAWEGEE